MILTLCFSASSNPPPATLPISHPYWPFCGSAGDWVEVCAEVHVLGDASKLFFLLELRTLFDKQRKHASIP